MWQRLAAAALATVCVGLLFTAAHRYNSAHDFYRRKPTSPRARPRPVSAIWTFTTVPDNKCVKRFRAMHPTTPVHTYTIERAATFIDEHCPILSKPYRDLRPIAFKADLWRYCALYTFGGAYLDDDLWLTEPLTFFDDVPGNVLLIENGFKKKELFPYRGGIWNAYMIAREPKDRVFQCAIDHAARQINARARTNLLALTGPDLLGECVLPTSDANIVGYFEGSFKGSQTWSHKRLNIEIKVPRDPTPYYSRIGAFNSK